jgi:hypothetical protein
MAVNEVIYRLKVDGSATADLTAAAAAAEKAASAEKALAAASKAAAAAQSQAQAVVVPTTAQLSSFGATAEEGALKVNKLGMAMGPLAGVIGKISPGAGAALSSVAGLTSTVQGLGAAGLTSAAGLASMAAMLAPIAVAVGALAVAYKHYSDELAAAEAHQQAMTDAATRAQKAHEELKANVSSLSERYRDAVGGPLGKAQDQLEKDMAAAAKSYEIRMSFARSIVGDYAKAQAAAAHAEAKRKEEEGQAYVIYEKAKAQTERRTAATQAQTAAVKELADAYQTLTTAAGTRYTYGPGGGEVVQRGVLTAAETAHSASLRADTAAMAQDPLTGEYISKQLEVIDTLDSWNTGLKESTDRMAAVSKGAGVVGSVAGGPSSMLSAMGPWGALVDAIVKAVTHFADLGDTFTQYTAEFNDALAKLPQTLMENLPRWLQEGTRSTFAMLPKLISTLVIEFFNPENWIKAAEGFIQGVSQGLTEGFSDYKAPSSQTGSFDLFGALGGSSGTSGGSSKSPDLFVKASDFWSDFTKAVDKETSAIGRAFA